jgi:hypothetical protein
MWLNQNFSLAFQQEQVRRIRECYVTPLHVIAPCPLPIPSDPTEDEGEGREGIQDTHGASAGQLGGADPLIPSHPSPLCGRTRPCTVLSVLSQPCCCGGYQVLLTYLQADPAAQPAGPMRPSYMPYLCNAFPEPKLCFVLLLLIVCALLVPGITPEQLTLQAPLYQFFMYTLLLPFIIVLLFN